MMKGKHVLLTLMSLTLALALVAGSTVAQGPAPQPESIQQTLAGNAFTYQGYLTDGGGPANGLYDFSFSLYADAAGTQWVASAAPVPDHPVVDGLFTVPVDVTDGLHSDVYFYLNGDARWLKIGVRPGASIGAYTFLSPLQPLTPAPYALALPGMNTIQNGTSANVVGGYSWNYVDPNVVGATIGGGGLSGGRNEVYGDYATVGGGRINDARQDDDTVGGGNSNTADGGHATVGGGYTNSATNLDATVAGGIYNTAGGESATIAGGSNNSASGIAGTVAGGALNAAAGNYSFAAGYRAKANHEGSFVWADHTAADFGSTLNNQVRLRATNGLELWSNNGSYGLRIDHNDTGTNGDGLRAIANVSKGSSWAAVLALNSGTSPAVYADTSGTYSGYFQDDIYVAGSCVGCTLVYVGLNDGDGPLETGDLVAISGLSSSLEGTTSPLMRVRRAGADNAQAIIGVVQGKAEIVESRKDGQVIESADRREGIAAPGEYLFIVVQGMAQVKADTTAGDITPGQRLTAAERAGHVRAVQTRTVEGMVVTEGAPVVGVALAPLDPATGLLPVLVSLR